MTRAYDEEDHPLSERGIEPQNEMLLRRNREFRRGANAVTAAWRAHPEVSAVSLIGSVARAPWKKVPRFGPYRRARVMRRAFTHSSRSTMRSRRLGALISTPDQETPLTLLASPGRSW